MKITQNTLTKISFSPKNRNLETEKNKAIKTPRKISIQKPVWLNGQTRPRCHKGMQMAAVPTAPVRRGACMMPRVGPLINIDLHGLQVQGLRVYGVCSHDSNTGIVSRLGNKGALYPSMCLFGVRLLLRSSKRDKKRKKIVSINTTIMKIYWLPVLWPFSAVSLVASPHAASQGHTEQHPEAISVRVNVYASTKSISAIKRSFPSVVPLQSLQRSHLHDSHGK